MKLFIAGIVFGCFLATMVTAMWLDSKTIDIQDLDWFFKEWEE